MPRNRSDKSNWKVIIVNIKGKQTNFYLDGKGRLINPIKYHRTKCMKNKILNKNLLIPPHPYSTAVISDSDCRPTLTDQKEDITPSITYSNKANSSIDYQSNNKISTNHTLHPDSLNISDDNLPVFEINETGKTNSLSDCSNMSHSETSENKNASNNSNKTISSKIMNSLLSIVFSTHDANNFSDSNIGSDYSDYESNHVDSADIYID